MLRFCFTSILLVFSAIAQANTEKPTLIALELPGLTDAEKKGVFSHVYYALQEKALIKSWEAAPIFRAHQKFLSKKAACIAPASLRLLEAYNVSPSEVSALIPFNRAQGYLLKSSGYTLESGEQPSLGIVGVGHLFGVEESAYKLVSVATYDQLLYLVGANRVSAAYVNYPDVIHHPKAMDIINDFDGEVELRWDGVDNIMCWKEHAEASDMIASAIAEWKKDGTLESMLGKYYIDLDIIK